MSTDPKESRQTRVVGPKFDAEGQARRFPGNTVISFLRERSPVEAELSWVLDMLAPLGFSAAFIPLPADSFHMTVFDLLCDQVRSKEHWSKRLPLDMPLGEIDAALSEWLDPLPDSDSIQ
ncbi:MAG: DUF1868 domain-containing protein, partial [Deltaproteobacteria bacterium]|nr:DUF1868 domain-containing protein [Deltaproteobacteria bacterium]